MAVSVESIAKDNVVGVALVRQWLILSLLPRPPQKIDAATIETRLRERGHAIHRRTIQRDLVELASVFPIIADERSKPYGWRWSEARDSRSPIPIHPDASHDGSRIHVRLRSKTSVAAEVAELLGLRPSEPGSADVLLLIGKVDDSPRLRRVLLAYGLEVDILDPSHLRDEVRARARRIAEGDRVR